MKYSVIIPVYNAEKTIDRCITSLIQLNFSDFEIILVNDGSPDDSLGICRDYEEKYPNIKVIDKENGGAASARNKGLDVAKGEYILFVDSDDYVLENYFTEIEKHTNDLTVFTDMWCFSAETKKREINGNLNGATLFEKKKYLIESRTINGPMTKVFKKSVIDEHQIRFNPQLPVAEDFDFGLKYLMCCEKIQIFNTAIYATDKTTESLMRKRKYNLIDDYKIAFTSTKNTITSSNLKDSEKTELLKIWDKLNADSFATCMMEEFKDPNLSPKDIKKEIGNLCEKFNRNFNDSYGYCNMVHFVLKFCIKHKFKNTLYYFTKFYVKRYR